MYSVNWFGMPLLNRYGDVVAAGRAIVGVVRALVAELHGVGAGDVRRRGVPGVRADPVRAPAVQPAVDRGSGCCRWSAQPARALLGDLNEAAIVAGRLAVVPVGQVGADARFEQQLVGRGRRPLGLLHALEAVVPARRSPATMVEEPWPMLSLLICSSQNRLNLLRGVAWNVRRRFGCSGPLLSLLLTVGCSGRRT